MSCPIVNSATYPQKVIVSHGAGMLVPDYYRISYPAARVQPGHVGPVKQHCNFREHRRHTIKP